MKQKKKVTIWCKSSSSVPLGFHKLFLLEISGLEAPETLFSLDKIESLFSDVPLLEDPSKLVRTFLAMSASLSRLPPWH